MTTHSSGKKALSVDWVGDSRTGNLRPLAPGVRLAVAPRDVVTVQDVDRTARRLRALHHDGRQESPAQLAVAAVE